MGRKESNQTNSLGIQIYEGVFDLLIVLDYMLFFPYFLKILHKNGIILSQRGIQENSLNPLWIGHWGKIMNLNCLTLRLCFEKSADDKKCINVIIYAFLVVC